MSENRGLSDTLFLLRQPSCFNLFETARRRKGTPISTDQKELPPHLRHTPEGETILKVAHELGWTPNQKAILNIWNKHKPSRSENRIRESIQKYIDRRSRPLLTASQVRHRLGISHEEFVKWWRAGRIHTSNGISGRNISGRPNRPNPPKNKPRFSEADVNSWMPLVSAWEEDERAQRKADKKRRKKVREDLCMDAPGQAYPVARNMERRIVFHSGPTNSGKTHEALKQLAAAQTGIYAAPLRLLAMEGYDRLNELGVDTGLRTGEEEIGVQHSTHLSCTIESLSPDREVDVVVIDEVQMLSDPDRGAAWTRALLAAPAKEIHLAGAADALPWIEAVLEQTGETVEIIEYERKSELHALSQPVKKCKPGDAVVVFSRRQIMATRAKLRGKGRSVAVIFGALPPEVRRREAERFATGEAEVLVATDAIGMGLNLPIKRVIFGAVVKFDGYTNRFLEPHEIRQIAGRAGRGHDNPGYAGVLSGLDETIVQDALDADFEDDDLDYDWENPGVRFRPEFLSKLPEPAGWSTYIHDIRSYRNVLPPGWRLDTGPDLDLAAEIADKHEAATDERAPFCFTAPIGDDSLDPATKALSAGMASLRKKGTWPVPKTPSSKPGTDAKLSRWTEIGRCLTVARWFCRQDRGQRINQAEVETQWEKYTAGLMEAMASRDLFQRTCPDCDKPLPWSHPHRFCDACFFTDHFDDYL
ncbi:helicase-related protein [Salipiger mucosus]|uniref:Helicase-like protein n=1 Tax=Salipiger mucosus DSM 16094 TaxID=1123237 RepID=S9SCD2_9RHOB|nr:helicase-related protein [Salipiger mucosus]EPX83899.1 Helicase-like protein [Salipiger mucosus DSM 16094]